VTPDPVIPRRSAAATPSATGGATDPGEKLSAAGTVTVQVSGNNAIPAGATAAVFNVTAVGPSARGYLTVYPQDALRPTVSNVNYVSGQTTGNRVIVPLSASGAITAFSAQATNVIVDVSGYFTAANGTGDQFSAAPAPVRICDTRAGNPSSLNGGATQCNGTANAGSPLQAQSTSVVQVSGLGGVPATATAAVLNVTAIDPSAQTYLSVIPGPTRPPTSDLNPAPGSVKAILTVATLSASGTVSIYNNAGSVNVAIDVLGWYSGTEAPPTVTGISPTSGPTTGGTTVSITGNNLTEATAVDFGANAATIDSDSATQVTATSPAGTAGPVDVTVTTPGGTSTTSSADKFTYTGVVTRAPTVTAVSPTSGTTAGGTAVVITGTNLTGASAVDFAGVAATGISVANPTTIDATTPAGSAGAVTVSVTTPGGTGTDTGAYTYVTPTPAPTVTGVSPTSGPTTGGTAVIITGTNLTGANSVKFGTAAATGLTVVNPTTIDGTTPADTSGAVNVSVTTPGGTGSDESAYTYVSPAPVVTAISPTSGPTTGGTMVTVTGTGLSSATAVDFASAPATGVTAVNSTTIDASSPAGTGTVDVTVTTSGGTSATTSADLFTYDSETDCTNTWVGTDSSSWSNPDNWSNNDIPADTDSVCIPADIQNLPVQMTTTATVSSFANDGGLDLSGSLTITVPASTSAGALTLTDNGTIAGPGNLTVTGSLTTNNGYFDGPGTVTVASGAVWSDSFVGVYGGMLVNEGTATVSSGGTIQMDEAGLFSNTGTLTLNAGSSIFGNEYLSGSEPPPIGFTNSGTILSDGTDSSPAEIYGGGAAMTYTDTGPIEIESGTLELGGVGGDYDADGVLEPGATITGPASSTLEIGPGTVTVDSGATISGPSTIDDIGELDLDTDLIIPILTSEVDSSIAGPGNLTVTGSLTTNNGYFDGPGTVTVASGAVWSDSFVGVYGGMLVNEGTATVSSGGTIQMDEAGLFSNTGTLTLNAGSSIFGNEYLSGSEPPPIGFTNSGTILSDGTDSSPAEIYGGGAAMTYTDTGPIEIESGTLELGGVGGDYDADGVLEPGATITGPASSTLEIGPGTVTVDESMESPMVSIDGGSLDLAPGSTLHTPTIFSSTPGTLELDANVAGQFGQLVVGGSATTTDLSLDLNTSYTPSCGTTVTAIRAGSVSGLFNSVSGSALPSGGTWEATSSATTAGAYIYCPPPPTDVSQTYGDGSSYDASNPAGYFAEPVNTATGAYSTTETDGKLPGIGVPFTFTRSYSSDVTATGPLGVGWTDTMNVTLTAGSGGDETLSDENGQQITFTPTTGDNYSGPAGTRSVLTSVAGGGWLLVRQDQEHLVFNVSGELTSETDRNGIGLTLSYDGSKQLTSVTDYAGRVVTFTYNGSGLLSSMALPLSRTVTYAYNASDQLTSVTNAAGGVTSYTYSAAGLLATITDQNGHQVVANTYNSSGQVISQVNSLGKTATFSYDASTQTCTYTDPDGHQWQDIYQDNVLVERIDPLGDVTSYSYDANLDLSAVTDPDGHTTTMDYDAAGNMTSRTSALPATQTWTYDAFNDVTSYTDPLGRVTTSTYDTRGNLLTKTLPNGAETTHTRDPTTGVVDTSTDANSNTTTDAYNSAGELVSVTSPLGEESTYTYDAAGRRVTMVDPRGNANGATPASHTTTYAYDALDRLTSVTNPDGDITSYGYDAVGNRTSVTDANGNTTNYTYDADDRLTGVSAPGAALTTTAYDAVGNRTSVTNANGHTTTYTYNAANRLITMTNALGDTTTYGYDPSGNRTSLTDAKGAVTSSTYDAANRLTGVSYSDATPSVAYSYDADNLRVEMTDGTGTTTYTYNTANELTGVTHGSATYAYTYDPDGDVTQRTYPDSTTITYTYDKDDRLASLSTGGATTTYSYDPDGDLSTEVLPSANGYTETATYDPAGHVATVADTKGATTLTSFTYTYDDDANPTTIVANGETDTYTYDTRDRLTKVCYATSCAQGSITYTYDADSNRSAETTTAGTTTYAYNAADQLASATGPTSTTDYTYDADGRRISAGTTTYTWDAADELTGLTSGGTTTTYTYDGDGNRATETTGTSTTDFSYDLDNALPTLAEETNGATELDRYVWGDGLLQSVTTGDATYDVAHDAQGSLVGLTSPTGATEAIYSYQPFGTLRAETDVAPGAPSIPLGFESQFLDQASGLYDLGARELDRTTGSFISTDPLAESPTAPDVSVYIYADDQPTVLWDPSGRCGESGGYYDSTDAEINNDIAVYENNQNVLYNFVGTITGLNDSPIQTGISLSGDLGSGLNTVYDVWDATSNGTQGLESY
jgi:RHS repeat-associated protein